MYTLILQKFRGGKSSSRGGSPPLLLLPHPSPLHPTSPTPSSSLSPLHSSPPPPPPPPHPSPTFPLSLPPLTFTADSIIVLVLPQKREVKHMTRFTVSDGAGMGYRWLDGASSRTVPREGVLTRVVLVPTRLINRTILDGGKKEGGRVGREERRREGRGK